MDVLQLSMRQVQRAILYRKRDEQSVKILSELMEQSRKGKVRCLDDAGYCDIVKPLLT